MTWDLLGTPDPEPLRIRKPVKRLDSNEALMENLVTYAIPQQDERPLAQQLLAELGALSAVLYL